MRIIFCCLLLAMATPSASETSGVAPDQGVQAALGTEISKFWNLAVLPKSSALPIVVVSFILPRNGETEIDPVRSKTCVT